MTVITSNEIESNSELSVKSSRVNIRFPIVLLSIFALSSMMSNVVCFNFVVLFMPSTTEAENANHTYIGYPKEERTLLLSSVAIGALVAVVPISHATHAYGTRKVFFAAGLLSTVATALIPTLSRLSLGFFVALRFMQGASIAASFPTVGSITSNWASLGQHGLFMSTLTTFGQTSAIFSMPVAGFLCTTFLGWKSVFYLHAIVSGIIFICWVLVYRNKPAKPPWNSEHEVSIIHKGKSTADLHNCKGDKKKIPYLAIVSTPAVWGIWIGALGDLFAVQLIHIFSPLYLHEVLGYSVQKTGWTAALPVLFHFFVKICAGHSSDRITGIAETTKLRIYNSLALGLAGVFIAALAFVPKGYPTWGIVLMTLSTAMFGFNGGGFNKCATLVSRQYSHFVMAIIQVILCLSMLISPIVVHSMLSTGSIDEWRLVFLSHAAFLIICNAIFCALATAKPALFAVQCANL
ncbi:hypothetical protein PRIPAC_81873 [Pristionchus pacificus]|uniref:Membrane transporter n=1 Tax=Pristionchus pacificus TaxID=54126 RepID=A0A2A6CN10_PRIPA|nr:hypothetical protein PRIPAC_81873 [Pristionchus pacificus]|eukprot:PDM79499.1 membrane transporter [Pristionchus pacificus]